MNSTRTCFFIGSFLVFFAIFIQKFNNITWTLQEIIHYWPLIMYGSLMLGLLFLIRSNVSRDYSKSFIYSIFISIYNKLVAVNSNKKETIIRELTAINNVLQQLKDTKQSKSLFEESNKLSFELKRANFRVVLFGSSSSGKTSLTRSLLGRVVGNVQASMGSTDNCRKYNIHFDRLPRSLTIIDTPGIFESGQQGYIREMKARWEVSRADLILFVIDKDLCSEEEEIIRSLSMLGKQLILVFNKCDLWTEDEEEYLLNILRFRCKKMIASSDILSTSSISQESLSLKDGSIHIRPEIERLTNRIITILNKYGEQLIINNILLQCQYLYKASKWLLNQQLQRDAQYIIEHYMWISTSAITLSGIPALDLVGMIAINTRMVMKIGYIYGVNLDFDMAKSLVVRLGRIFITLGIVKSGSSIIRAALSLNTPMMIIGKIVEAITFAWLTRLIGLSFITYFQNKQQWGQSGIHDVVKYHYEINKKDELLKHFLEVAFNRIVEPLKQNIRQ